MGLLFQSRDAMHLTHLKTTSFAEHKALNAYYDGILDLTDSFIETYFGRNGRIEIIIPEAKSLSAMEHLKELQKILDAEMLGLVNKTLYLLTLV